MPFAHISIRCWKRGQHAKQVQDLRRTTAAETERPIAPRNSEHAGRPSPVADPRPSRPGGGGTRRGGAASTWWLTCSALRASRDEPDDSRHPMLANVAALVHSPWPCATRDPHRPCREHCLSRENRGSALLMGRCACARTSVTLQDRARQVCSRSSSYRRTATGLQRRPPAPTTRSVGTFPLLGCRIERLADGRTDSSLRRSAA